jgi:hypothetical protein
MVGIFLLILVSGYPDMARRFPLLILITFVILVGLDILKKLRTGIWETSSEDKDEQKITEESQRKIRAVYTLGLMLAFVGCMLVFGFTLGTFIFLLFSCYILGYRHIKGLIFSTVIITGFMYVIFILIMKCYLPRGYIFEILGG